jgi:hypothetical protein
MALELAKNVKLVDTMKRKKIMIGLNLKSNLKYQA